MIKFFMSWKDNPNLSKEECEKHYSTVHTELAKKGLKNAPGFRRYVQNRVVSHTVINFNECTNAVEAEPEFDWFAEFYFDSKEDMEKAFSSPEIQACYGDHKNFMDVNIPANIKIYEVIERIPLKKK